MGDKRIIKTENEKTEYIYSETIHTHAYLAHIHKEDKKRLEYTKESVWREAAMGIDKKYKDTEILIHKKAIIVSNESMRPGHSELIGSYMIYTRK